MFRVPVPFVAKPRVRVARGAGSLSTGANASKRAADADSQARENRSDNFFTFVTPPKQIVRASAHADV
jgi:hypothetical protein